MLCESWITQKALAIGLYCAFATENLESAVVMAINQDGDSDSTAGVRQFRAKKRDFR